MSDKIKLGNVVEATLAASDAALCLEECQQDKRPPSDWRRRFTEIVGGGHAEDDLVAQYIGYRAYWVQTNGCDCAVCNAYDGMGPVTRGPPYLHLNRQRALADSPR